MFQRNRATAGFDRTHVLQIGWLYELPFGKGKMLAQVGRRRRGSRRLAGQRRDVGLHRHAVHGRRLRPRLNAPNNTQTANQVGPGRQRIGDVGPGTRYYDPAAFASVGIVNTFGSSGRNILRNPGVWNTDLNITREFRDQGDGCRMQFRGEFFNFPNTSHFSGLASANVTGGANFMSIRSASGERQIRFGLRFQW